MGWTLIPFLVTWLEGQPYHSGGSVWQRLLPRDDKHLATAFKTLLSPWRHCKLIMAVFLLSLASGSEFLSAPTMWWMLSWEMKSIFFSSAQPPPICALWWQELCCLWLFLQTSLLQRRSYSRAFHWSRSLLSALTCSLPKSQVPRAYFKCLRSLVKPLRYPWCLL